MSEAVAMDASSSSSSGADSPLRSSAVNCNASIASTPSATAPASPTVTATPSTPSSSSVPPSLLSSPPSPPLSSPPTPPVAQSFRSLISSPASLSSSPPPSAPSSPHAPLRSCLLRLQSDYKQLEADPPEGIDASPADPSNLLLWRGCLFGPCDSEWEGAVLPLQLSFPPDYPLKPPQLRFTCRVFHPNVFADGQLCLDLLQNKWSPVYSVASILQSVQSLLCDPNVASPANAEAARLWSSDQKEYRKRVRAVVAGETERSGRV